MLGILTKLLGIIAQRLTEGIENWLFVLFGTVALHKAIEGRNHTQGVERVIVEVHIDGVQVHFYHQFLNNAAVDGVYRPGMSVVESTLGIGYGADVVHSLSLVGYIFLFSRLIGRLPSFIGSWGSMATR
jgi:hypothetical protein